MVACVIEREGKFLINQRKKQSHMGHLWEFPGGKIERGETLEDCAIRECQEEIAVTVQLQRVLQEIQHDYPEVSVHLYFTLCDLVEGEPKVVDCADLTWVTPAEFDRYPFPEADKQGSSRFLTKAIGLASVAACFVPCELNLKERTITVEGSALKKLPLNLCLRVVLGASNII